MKVCSGAPKKFPCPKNNDQIRPLDNVKKRLADDKILLLIYTFAPSGAEFPVELSELSGRISRRQGCCIIKQRKRSSLMLKFYVKASETLRQLRSDEQGVVSFEYIIVAVCIITTVGLVFAATGSDSISGALSTGVGRISTALNP